MGNADVVGTPERRQPTWYLVLRLGGRALTLYAAQIMITMIAMAMLAGVAILLDNPLLLEWHNAAAVFHDPVPTHIGLGADHPSARLFRYPAALCGADDHGAGLLR